MHLGGFHLTAENNSHLDYFYVDWLSISQSDHVVVALRHWSIEKRSATECYS